MGLVMGAGLAYLVWATGDGTVVYVTERVIVERYIYSFLEVFLDGINWE
jgi:hypothetical protein